MSDRSRQSREAFSHHGSRAFQKHDAGEGCEKNRPQVGLSIPASRQSIARLSGRRFFIAAQSDIRAWLFLAPARKMQICHHSENACSILASKILRQYIARSPFSTRIEKYGLGNSDSLAM
ncbi:MAG TPA: hypothetical protein VN670_06110 [Acidobacteriaceae bacterium]|nr:hypothetical protein [Acidobacteriaceae bacterium]